MSSSNHSLQRRSALFLTAGSLVTAALSAGLASGATAQPAVPAATAVPATPGGADRPTVSIDPPPPAPSTTWRAGSPSTATATVPGAAAYSLNQTFLLHSKPGSQRTIYVDFDGMTVSGTRWNAAVDGHAALPAGAQPAWSLDASSAFSDVERSAVQDVWQAVAEDFAPFDVDVTTEQPAADTLDRTTLADTVYGTTALVTGGSGDAARSTADDALCNSTCAGIAYNRVFALAAQGGTTHNSWQPALVFGEKLFDAHSIADTVSHEVGHNLGLDHDGTTAAAYYGGQGAWGPIMGSPSAYPVTQWSRGEYAGASQTQDDVAVIGAASGAPLRADDAADTVSAATPLPLATGTPSSTGTITAAGDVDVFALGTCTGTVTASATPAAAYSPDVDLSVAVLTADGNAVAGPVDQATTRTSRSVAAGLGATVTYDAGTGRTLFVRVDGVGSGSATGTGYSDYGSLGRYLVDLQGTCSGTAGVPGSPVGVAATASGTSVTLTWSPPTSAGLSAVTSYVVTSNADELLVPAASTSATFTGLAPGRAYSFSVAARNARGTGLPTWAEVAIPAAPVVDGPTGTPTANPGPGSVAVPGMGGPLAALSALTAPSVKGPARVGSKLAVRPGTWSRPATLSYQWYVGGVAVRGTGPSYRPRATQVGKPLTVRVTAATSDSRVVVVVKAGRVRR